MLDIRSAEPLQDFPNGNLWTLPPAGLWGMSTTSGEEKCCCTAVVRGPHVRSLRCSGAVHYLDGEEHLLSVPRVARGRSNPYAARELVSLHRRKEKNARQPHKHDARRSQVRYQYLTAVRGLSQQEFNIDERQETRDGGKRNGALAGWEGPGSRSRYGSSLMLWVRP